MLKIGIVGVGGYGAEHLKGLCPLESAGRIRVTALADLSVPALEKARTDFPGAQCYSDYRVMLDEAEICAVILATPIPLHEEMTLEAVRRGMYVLLEKPAVPLVSQWERLVAADIGNKVAVGFQRISSSGHRITRRLIEQGALGKLRSLTVSAIWPRTDWYYKRNTWAGQLFWNSRPVLDGPATNAFAHYVNDLMFFAGAEAQGFMLPNEVYGEVYRARRVASYDTACLHGSFSGGEQFFGVFSHAASRTVESVMRLEGTKGAVWLMQDGSVCSDDIEIPNFEPSDGRKEMWERFVDFTAGRRPRPDVALQDLQGYTLATNLMLQSAGKIRTIAGEHIESATDESGGAVVSIKHLASLFQKAARQRCPLSEVGISWAHRGTKLAAADFSESRMLEGLDISALHSASPFLAGT